MTSSNDMKSLRDRGHRLTPQRLAILQILEENGGHLTPTQLYERAVERMPGLTEATVYRTLDFLSRHGLALVAYMGSGHLVYEAAGREHHHLVCKDCGGAVEIEHKLLEELYQDFFRRTGFQIDSSHVTFFGLCPGCQKRENN